MVQIPAKFCKNGVTTCVGVPGVEPGTSSLSVTRSNHLSYTPTQTTTSFLQTKRTMYILIDINNTP